MSRSNLHGFSLMIRWTARVVGTLMVALFIFMFVGYALAGEFLPIFHLTPAETLEMIAGIGIAWRWELPGGLMVFTAGLMFTLIESIESRSFDPIWFAIVFMVVGALFVLAWYVAGRNQVEVA